MSMDPILGAFLLSLHWRVVDHTTDTRRLYSRRNRRHPKDSIWGARLRWAARVDDELTATEGGDPSGTYKRWFGRVSGRAGWWRGSSLVDASYWSGGPRGVRAGWLPRARPCPTDGRSDAVAARTTLVRW